MYRGRVVLSAPPPQTGMQVIHTLKLLESYDLPSLGLPTRSAQAFDVMASALRNGMPLVGMNGDPSWANVPAVGVISEEFAAERRRLVGTGTPPDTVPPADPARHNGSAPQGQCASFEPYRQPATVAGSGPGGAALYDPVEGLGEGPVESPVDGPMEGGETTHISVVDADGNAVALTHTNSSVFGSGAMVGGFILNNSGFRFDQRSLAAKGRSPWRTRRTTISPTVILEDGRVRMVVGAPGGGRIPTAVSQVISYVLDYGLDPLEAVRMPRLFPSPNGLQVQLEGGYSAEVLERVREMGYQPTALSSGYAIHAYGQVATRRNL